MCARHNIAEAWHARVWHCLTGAEDIAVDPKGWPDGHLHAVLEASSCSIPILRRHALRLVLRQSDLHIQQRAA